MNYTDQKKKFPAEKSPEIIEESGSKKSLMQKLIASMNEKTSGMVDYVELAFDVHIKDFNDDAFSSKYKKAWNFIMEYDRKTSSPALNSDSYRLYVMGIFFPVSCRG